MDARQVREARKAAPPRARLAADLSGAALLSPPDNAAVPQPGLVQLALLTMERLARASARASFTGTEECVAAPDEATAAIFRAVLAETRQTRPTDRLIRVVVVD